jgi:glucose/arabinose dehydrogenase
VDEIPEPVTAENVDELKICEFVTRWKLEVVAENLEVPWDIEVAPDSRIFVTERPGRVRIIEDDELLREPWLTIDVASVGVIGLTGIALDPDFDTNRYVYLALQYKRERDTAIGNFILSVQRRIARAFGTDKRFAYYARIVRFTDVSGQAANPLTIIDGIPADPWHGTVSLNFGPDNDLYVSTGYATDLNTSQDDKSLGGKLLRLKLSPERELDRFELIASGLRQSQGVAWTTSDYIVMTEHGAAGYDELNALGENGNFGWPIVAGPTDDSEFVSPLVTWVDGIAPADVGVLRWGPDSSADESLIVTSLRGRRLKRIPVRHNPDSGNLEASCQEDLFQDEIGRIRSIYVTGPREALISTSNRDFRGDPHDGDDRILRITAIVPE